MAITKYNVTQRATINGTKKVSSFSVNMESADLGTFLGLLEGGYSVTKADDSLTDVTNEDVNVTSVNAVSKIFMNGKDANGNHLSASIRPYKGVIYLKNTTDSDALNAALSAFTPFPLAPTEKPTSISATFTEVATASE